MAKTKKPWSLLSTHGLILVAIARHPELTVVELADRVNVGKATVMRTLRDLRSAGMLEIHRQGRRNVYRVHTDVNFRHPVMHDSQIRLLVDAFQDR